ncbi:MAG: DUF4912 domain-containing protein [Zavarzinella sp.]
MTLDELKASSRKDLLQFARELSIVGINSMAKPDLIKAISRILKKEQRAKDKEKAAKAKSAKTAEAKAARNGKASHAEPVKPVKVVEEPAPTRKKPAPAKGTRVATPPSANGSHYMRNNNTLVGGHPKDRLIVIVRDSYWLQVCWELSDQSLQRAEAALGQDWHGSKPIIRVFDVSANDTTSTAEAVVADVNIHGGCNTWYIEVQNPPKSYRADIGYISKRGQFYALVRSNVVNTPKPGAVEGLDDAWADIDAKQADRLYTLTSTDESSPGDNQLLKEFFEERLKRPMSAPTISTPSAIRDRKFFFQLDAELIVFGSTVPGSNVTIQGEPIKLRPNGTFMMRYSFPDGRQILPATAETMDGMEERRIVLAVERNTKELGALAQDTADN